MWWSARASSSARRSAWRACSLTGSKRLVDRREHGLAVGVPPLVLAHPAELRRRQALESSCDLGRGQIVVAEDRERLADADAAPGSVRAADEQIDRLAPPRAAGGRAELLATATDQPLDV